MSTFLDGRFLTAASSGAVLRSVEKGARPAGNMSSGQKFFSTVVRPLNAEFTMDVRSSAVIIALRSAALAKIPALVFIHITMTDAPKTVVTLNWGFFL